jgi:thiopeptide-type bacteriocin biosynthesis protein
VSPALSGSRTAAVRRSFPPGSAWLYAKLFTGAGAADDVLREIVTPLVHEVMEAGAVERWFFLRFGDPAWHLRLRLFGEPHRLMSDVLPALQHACEPALEAGSVWRLQLDTYEREVARYGGDVGIALAEEVFYADSEAVLSLIHELSPDTGARARWMLTLLGMDRMLGDLGFDLAARLALCRDLRAGFAREFLTAEDKVFERSLGARYRTERIELEALLEGRGDPALIAAADEAFGQRSRQLAPTIAALVAADAAGALATPLTELAGSFLHLHANRLLRASHRQQELVLADYLCRLYESRLARIR